MQDLRDRIALVTGGSRRIGAAVAIVLAKAGTDVAVNYRERADAANAVCGEITGTGRKAVPVQADVSVLADVKRMVADIEAHLGGVSILVNNAAIAHPYKLEDITESGMGRRSHRKSKVGLLSDAGGRRRDAAKKMGAHLSAPVKNGTILAGLGRSQ